MQYIKDYSNNNICFCPEFLKERNAYNDFKYNNHVCIVGTISEKVFETMKIIHSEICINFKMVNPTEAELSKYFQNVYNMNRIIFANAFYEVCKSKNICYNNIIENLLVRGEIDKHYLHCDESLRGPSGPCIVKDTLVFNEYVKKTFQDTSNNKISIFQTMIDDSKLYPKTVIGSTRTEIDYFGKNL
jgi:UDP-glucose 6-dehydrogenase